MNNSNQHSIFTLLYAMVVIDNQVIKVEVDEFFKSVEDILTSIGFIETYQARSHVSAWFVNNYKNILTEMKSPHRDVFLLKHVEQLKPYQHRQIIFEMMKKIAISDGENHDLEQQFLEKVSKAWKVQ